MVFQNIGKIQHLSLFFKVFKNWAHNKNLEFETEMSRNLGNIKIVETYGCSILQAHYVGFFFFKV